MKRRIDAKLTTFKPQPKLIEVPRPEVQIQEHPLLGVLKQVPGISPFLIPDILPDLIYLYQTDLEGLKIAIAKADPKSPVSILFSHPSQDVHKAKEEKEINLMTDIGELIEREGIKCKCGSGFVQINTRQSRRADEPATVDAHCVECGRNWSFSSA